MEQSVRMRVPLLHRPEVLPRGCLGCAALVALLGIASVAGVGTTDLAAPSRQPVLHGDVVWPPGKRRAPPFALRDQRGARVSLSGERGRVVMLTFMYSRCRSAGWRWLVGSRRELKPVGRAYRIDVQAGRDIGHSSALYLIDRHGYERAGYAVPFLPKLVAADVRTLAAERVSK